MIKVISKLNLNNKGELIANRQVVPLQQGDMDGACTVYSLMMVLIILKIIPRKVATNIWMKIKGSTREGKLVKFINSSGLFRGGFNMGELSEQFNVIYGRICKSTHFYDDGETALFDILKDEIDADNPCLIGVSYNKKSGHALAAVGYEINARRKRIFCLDPGSVAPVCGYWNAVIELDKFNTKYSDYYLPSCNKVKFDQVITFSMK